MLQEKKKNSLIKLDKRCHNIYDNSKSVVNDYAFSCICINCILVAEAIHIYINIFMFIG